MKRHTPGQTREQRQRWIDKRLAWMDTYYQGSPYNRYWHRQVPLGKWSKNKPLGCSCWMCQGNSFADNRKRFYRKLDRYDQAAWGA